MSRSANLWKYKPDVWLSGQLGLQVVIWHCSLRAGPTEKLEGAMAHTNEIKFIRIHEFCNNNQKEIPAMLILASHTLEKRDQGRFLVSTPEIISREFVFRSLMESCISFQSFQGFSLWQHCSLGTWVKFYN